MSEWDFGRWIVAATEGGEEKRQTLRKALYGLISVKVEEPYGKSQELMAVKLVDISSKGLAFLIDEVDYEVIRGDKFIMRFYLPEGGFYFPLLLKFSNDDDAKRTKGDPIRVGCEFLGSAKELEAVRAFARFLEVAINHLFRDDQDFLDEIAEEKKSAS
jgi:hypothetical protein